MKKGMKIIVVGAVFLAAVRSTAQTIDPNTIEKQFTAYQQNAVQEKLFAHTDKSFYLTGEILWVKLYVVDAFFNRPADISKLAYIEALDKDNRPVLQAKIALKEGEGSGTVFLPSTLASGIYRLRAYTNWMKNFGAEHFFEKTITVINTRKAYQPVATSPVNKFDLQFFPEGGNMVSGLESKVAFRLVDRYGAGMVFNGSVISDLGDTVARFAPLHAGIGHFLFTPLPGRSYRAIAYVSGADTLSVSLPQAYKKGWVMRLTPGNNNQVRITVSSEPGGSPDQQVFLFAHTRGISKTVLSGSLRNGHAEFTVDGNLLGDGISHFTIFNGTRQPVCERLYFKAASKEVRVNIETDQEAYESRKKVDIRLSLSGTDGIPVLAKMSMSVYRIDSLQSPDETDIKDYLWLGSDLMGNIESPEYYFGAGAGEAMDNLMLTHGWRRFRWEDALNNKKPVFEFPPEFNGHFVNGRVVHVTDGTPGINIAAYISVPGRRIQFRSALSDPAGRIRFLMKDFYGPQVIVQTNILKDSLYRVELSNPFYEKYSGATLPDLSISETAAAALLERHIGVQAQNIYLGDTIALFQAPAIDTAAFYGKPDAEYVLDNYTRFTTLEEIMREYVPLAFVRKREGRFHFSVFERDRRILFSSDPLVLLDGTPVFDVNRFLKYDPLKIQKLEMIARRYYYGSLSYEGILRYTTYLGDLPNYELDRNATVLDYDGLQLQREFFSPAYSTPAQVSSRLPDFRNLLYWSPSVRTGVNGKEQISFYTSDLAGKYRVVLQGITPDGLPISEKINFTVNKKE